MGLNCIGSMPMNSTIMCWHEKLFQFIEWNLVWAKWDTILPCNDLLTVRCHIISKTNVDVKSLGPIVHTWVKFESKSPWWLPQPMCHVHYEPKVMIFSYLRARIIQCELIASQHSQLVHDWADIHRADSRFAPIQWGTSLQSNTISHWLGANLESALIQTCFCPAVMIHSWFHQRHFVHRNITTQQILYCVYLTAFSAFIGDISFNSLWLRDAQWRQWAW